MLRAESTPVLAAPTPDAQEVSPKRRRRILRRIFIGLNIFLGICVLTLGAGVGYFAYQESRINKIKIDRPGVGGEGPLIPVVKGSPVNILVVGSDSRAAAKEARDRKQFGSNSKVDGQRSDTMMVVRLDPKNDKATILSIPRDMYVDLEGGGKGRLNQAFADVKDNTKADPDRLIRTIYKNFGVPINHYVEIDFFGFRDAVNAIGGVKVYFEFPARDAFSLLNIKTSGCVQLDGDAALSYVRSRHYQYQQNGRWKDDPTSDFGRIKRQQDFLRRLVRKAIADGLTNPLKAHRLIDAGVKNLTVDKGFGVSDMKNLASQLRGVDEGGLVFLSIPGESIMVNGDSVLRLDKEGANEALVAFGAPPLVTTTTAKPGAKPTTPPTKVETGIPSDATVRIYNTTTKGGLATSTAKALGALGVRTATGNNRAAVPASQIRYPSGGEATAKALQALVGGGATLEVDPTVRKGEMLLLLGSGFTGIQVPAPPTPTTAAPEASTTSVAPPTTLPAKGSDPSKTC